MERDENKMEGCGYLFLYINPQFGPPPLNKGWDEDFQIRPYREAMKFFLLKQGEGVNLKGGSFKIGG